MPDLLAELRGARRALLTLAILFFTVMLLEVYLGHRPALARHGAWLALVPVVWLPLSLLVLMAVQIKPSAFTAGVSMAVMAIAAAVGMVGSGLHMLAAGVSVDKLAAVFSSSVWGGHASPNWPVAISVAAVLGFVASVGAGPDSDTWPKDAVTLITGVAFVLIAIGIGFAVVPELVTVSATCLGVAALLLLSALIGMLANAATERKLP
jgi:hypothetical protein